jgi:hypothetical protein
LVYVVDYMKALMRDYTTSIKDGFKSAQDYPVRAALYTGAVGGLVALNYTNPTYASYIQRVVEANDELGLISDTIRSKRADNLVQNVFRLHAQSRLRRQNFLVFSVVLAQRHADPTCIYEARCTTLNRFELSDYLGRVLDFGIAGRWLALQTALVDCDVNEGEFAEDGSAPKSGLTDTFLQRVLQNAATYIA